MDRKLKIGVMFQLRKMSEFMHSLGSYAEGGAPGEPGRPTRLDSLLDTEAIKMVLCMDEEGKRAPQTQDTPPRVQENPGLA